MRLRFLLLLLASTPAVAEPMIRWMDRTGSVKRAAISAVLAENSNEVRVELTTGRELTVPTRLLLTLVREDDTDAEQRALLAARGAAYLGGPLADARATCDRLTPGGKQAWIKEYAAAHRALIATRAKEQGAKQRVLGFLDKYPSSRFKGWLIYARTLLQAREAEDGIEIQRILETGFDDIMHAKGPLVVAFECLVERGRLYAFGDWSAVGSFAQGIRERFQKQLEGESPDAALSVVVESSMIRIAMEWHEDRYVKSVRRNLKPHSARYGVAALRRKSEFLLPELRSDVAGLMARIYRACGDVEAAKSAFAEQLKLAPDPWRQARAARK